MRIFDCSEGTVGRAGVDLFPPEKSGMTDMTKPGPNQTSLLHAGRPKSGWVNTPVSRASTFVFETMEALHDARARRDAERVPSYGARGTDSTMALEELVEVLEGGYRSHLFPTGQAAIATVLTGFLNCGDHILLSDAVYDPVRRLVSVELARLGVEHTVYKPDGSDIGEKIKDNTRLIYVESPGSMTYDIVDLPAIARLAHERGILVVADNTWGSGILYRPLDLGADLSISAATKYMGGHADVMMGIVVANEAAWPRLHEATVNFGQTVGADDAFLVARGIRSLPLRLKAHGERALAVAEWLLQRPEVAKVYCPALPGDRYHALWKRDCSGTNGLLSVALTNDYSTQDVEGLAETLKLFGIGASWGGFESLIMPSTPQNIRTLSDWKGHGPFFRLHIGLEEVDDLIADLARGMDGLRRA